MSSLDATDIKTEMNGKSLGLVSLSLMVFLLDVIHS